MDASGIIIAALDSTPEAIESWNSWYDLDHLPPNVALPGIMSGRRYVCTAPLHEYRSSGDDPWWQDGRSSFLTIYTLSGDVNETFAAMVTLREELVAADRMFADEQKVVRGGDGLTLQRATASAELPNAPRELAFLGHTGLLVVRRRDGAGYSADDHDVLAQALLPVDGCAALISFRSVLNAATGLHVVLLGGDHGEAVTASAEAAAQALVRSAASAAFNHCAYQAISPLEYPWAEGLRAAGLPAHRA